MDRPVIKLQALLESAQASEPVVRVGTAARLHLGFLDPGASLGRRFGSLGLTIEGFDTQVQLRAADRDHATADGDAAAAALPRAMAHLERLREVTGLRDAFLLHLPSVSPAHSGLGSGTQLAMAVGWAFARWHGLQVSAPQLARWLGRGHRSGIGVGGFEQGGLLLDGGPAADGRPAPVLARIALPSAWRVLVLQDPSRHGLSGAEEARHLAALPPLRRSQAADLCHQVLMRILPGAAQDDFAAFAQGLNQVQQVLGQHFAPAQGGVFASPVVARAAQAVTLSMAGAPVAIGQSSWGPSGFAIFDSAEACEAALARLDADAGHHLGLVARMVRPYAGGARVFDHRPA